MKPTESNTTVLPPRSAPKTFLSANKEKVVTYAYLFFSFIAISFFGIFAILPTLSTITTLNKQYEDNQKVVEALDTKLAALSALDREYQALEIDLPYIYNAIPSSAQIPTFTRQIETVAQKNNVTLTSFSTGTVEYFPVENTESNLFSYAFNLEASGTEQNINNFINEIISFNRLVAIDQITSGKDQQGIFKTNLGGKVYFSKDM